MRKIEVVAYRPSWADDFEQEKNAIAGSLCADNLAGIHHIGSTSVTGLAAKPLIDILLEVNDLAALDQQTAAMEALGYVAKGEFGIPERRFFYKGETERTHHVHAFVKDSPGSVRHLAFRDYLRAFPEVCEQYAALKQEGAAQCQHDNAQYCAHKNDFVQLHEQAALKWKFG